MNIAILRLLIVVTNEVGILRDYQILNLSSWLYIMLCHK